MLKYVSAILVLLGFAGFYLFYLQDNAPETKLTPEQLLLVKIGDKCIDFADKSVANDIPIIEFQQLERVAKRITTLTNCMTDNGYKQNPAWLAYAEPITKNNAEKEKLSFNEALTNLSRQEMQSFKAHENKPIYWVKTK